MEKNKKRPWSVIAGKRRWCIVFAVLASFGATATAALAITEGQANLVAIGWATETAGCSQGYWTCTAIVADCVNTGTNQVGRDQWDCAVYLTRLNARDNNRQWCHTVVGLGPYGGNVYGPSTHCFSLNARDPGR